mgnify:FL=1
MANNQLTGIFNAISVAGNRDGLIAINEPESEVGIRGRYIDAYALLSTLSERIQAGDVILEIKEIGDSCQKKEYFDRLCESCQLLTPIAL